MKKTFKKFSSFFVEGGVQNTIQRFLLSSLCAFAATLIVVLVNHGVIDSDEPRIVLTLVFGFFWFGASALIKESLTWSKVKGWVLGAGVFSFVAVMTFMTDQFEQYFIFIIPATLLLLMVAPFVTKLRDTETDFSFWQFNFSLWSGVLVSFFVIIVLTAGLHLAFYSIEVLFGWNFSHRIMEDIWAISAMLVGPIFALSRVPEQFKYDPVECADPMGMRFILNWILAPLIVIYFVILYAYLVKIIVTQQMPLGELAYMVSGFAGVSIATYLVGWPMRDNAGALIRKIYKYMFIGLAIPVVMQIIAIAERIYSFGVTEQRYIVLLSALWLVIIIAVFVFRKSASIKIIPAVLAGLLIIAAFGPWGAIGMSSTSQLNRLEGLLNQYGILKEGKIVETTEAIPFEDRKSITSKVQYLKKTKRFAVVTKWLDDKNQDSDSDKEMLVTDVIKQMGFDPVYNYQKKTGDGSFRYRSDNAALNVTGYDYLSKTLYIYKEKVNRKQKIVKITPEQGESFPDVTLSLNDNNLLIVGVEGRGVIEFDLTDYVEDKIKKSGVGQYVSTLTRSEATKLNGNIDNIKIRLVIASIYGKIEDETPMVENISFAVLLDL